MFGLILIVATLNISLGFAGAVLLGRRYHALLERDTAADLSVASRQDAEPLAGSAPAVEDDLSATSPSPQGVVEDAGGEQAYGPTVGDPQETVWEKPPTVVAMEQLREQLQHYHDGLSQVDSRLRACGENPPVEEAEACRTAFLEASDAFIGARVGTEPAWQSALSNAPSGQAAVVGEVRSTLHAHQAQIETAQSAIRELDLQADPQTGCKRLLTESLQLVDAGHQLRDVVEEAVIAAADDRPVSSLDHPEFRDELTGLFNRAGLEIALARLWQEDVQRSQRLAVAMFDIDQFVRVNERFGRRAGDRVLRAVAQLLGTEGRRNNVAARYSGQRFMLLFPESDIRYTTNAAERIRQTLETTCFEDEGREIRTTISCAVMEANADDTSQSLFARAEATLAEAKRYGKNRTFVHEGKYPTPVVPPNFALEERAVAL